MTATLPTSVRAIRRKMRDDNDGKEPAARVKFFPSEHPVDNAKDKSNTEARVRVVFSGYMTLRKDGYIDLPESVSKYDIAEAEVELLKHDPWSVLDWLGNLEGVEIQISMVPDAEGK